MELILFYQGEIEALETELESAVSVSHRAEVARRIDAIFIILNAAIDVEQDARMDAMEF